VASGLPQSTLTGSSVGSDAVLRSNTGIVATGEQQTTWAIQRSIRPILVWGSGINAVLQAREPHGDLVFIDDRDRITMIETAKG